MERYRKSEYESKIHETNNTVNYDAFPIMKVIEIYDKNDS